MEAVSPYICNAWRSLSLKSLHVSRTFELLPALPCLCPHITSVYEREGLWFSLAAGSRLELEGRFGVEESEDRHRARECRGSSFD